MKAFDEYIDMYGFHFNKKLYEWAVSMMTDRNGNKLPPMTKEQVDEFLHAQGVQLKNNKGHDATYVYSMAKSDYYGSSIMDDAHLAKYIKDYLDDPDGYPTRAFDEYVVKCRAKGEYIYWDEVI